MTKRNLQAIVDQLASEPVTDADIDEIERTATNEIARAQVHWLARIFNRDRLRLCRALREARERVSRLQERELSLQVILTEHMEPEVARLRAELERIRKGERS
jgi:hypothetical protein